MFQSVRHWWGSGRGKVTARLFLFEFVVVVLGVLVAQGLANWVGEQAARREVADERDRMRYEIGRARQMARVWKAVTPCLRERNTAIAQMARRGESPSLDFVRFPRSWTYLVEPFPPDMLRRFRQQYGSGAADNYGMVAAFTDGFGNIARDLGRGWARFSLLDRTFGPPSPANLEEIRDIAIQNRMRIDAIDRNIDVIDDVAKRLGIAPQESTSASGLRAPVRSCEEMWRTGKIYRDEGA